MKKTAWIFEHHENAKSYAVGHDFLMDRSLQNRVESAYVTRKKTAEFCGVVGAQRNPNDSLR